MGMPSDSILKIIQCRFAEKSIIMLIMMMIVIITVA